MKRTSKAQRVPDVFGSVEVFIQLMANLLLSWKRRWFFIGIGRRAWIYGRTLLSVGRVMSTLKPGSFASFQLVSPESTEPFPFASSK